MEPGNGGKLARSAGSSQLYLDLDDEFLIIKFHLERANK